MQGKLLVLLVLLTSACASLVFGAQASGTILGTVTDPSGGVVPGAKVSIRNQDTNALRELTTSARGEYVAPLLPPGRYQVTVEAARFRRAVYGDIRLNVDEAVRCDAQLQLGELIQEIVVNEAAPLVQSDTSTVGHTVDRQRVGELPLNERNFLSFTLLVPGAQMPSEGSLNSSRGAAISVNGAREQSNTFLLDGIDNNEPVGNHYSVLPSVDAIEEFKVQSSNSSAEYGRTGGAQINIVLKSGTNRLHGALFEFLRNRKLDAKNYFDLPDCTAGSPPRSCADIPRLDRNQFGATLGGPIRRDKTFFFGSYEGLRLRQAATREATVPSQVERRTALAAVPPERRNPAGVAVLNLLPAANVGPDLDGSNTFVWSAVIRHSVNQALGKLDYRAGVNDAFSGHYALFNESRFNPFDPNFPFTNLPGFGVFTRNRGQSARLGWTHIFHPALINEFRFGYNRLHTASFQQSSGTSKSRELGFPDVLTRPEVLGYPNVTIRGFDGIGEPTNRPLDFVSNTFHYANHLAWTPALHGGRHHFKFGGEVRRLQVNFFLEVFGRGWWFFEGGSPLESLLRGTPDFAIGRTGDTLTALRSTAVSGYFQDDFRVRPSLTLNLGLRYEYNGPPVDTHDRFGIPNLSPSAAGCSPQPDCLYLRAGARGVPRGVYEPDRNNFAPRVGLAWRPRGGNRFVTRAAYGVFYDVAIQNLGVFSRFNPPFFSIHLFPNRGNNTIQNILSGPGQPHAPGLVASDFRDGYMQHWNANLQYQLRQDLVVDLAYVGAKGTSLLAERNANQPRPGANVRPFPQFGSIFLGESRASSSYHALQFRTEKRFRQRLALLLAYTWSKSIDDSSGLFGTAAEFDLPQDSFNLRGERGLSNFHANHRLVLSYLYALPLGAGRRWVNRPGFFHHLLGNWRIGGIWAFQSGRPFTVNRAVDQSGTLTERGIFDRPDQIADPFRPGPVPNHPDPACHATVSQGGRAAAVVRDPKSWFNPCAFAAPATIRFGTAGRNSVLGPDLKNIDVSIVKEVPVRREGQRLQLRVEFFNFPNHPNFDLPNRIFDARTFSAVQSSNAYGNKPPRQVQLGLRYVF